MNRLLFLHATLSIVAVVLLISPILTCNSYDNPVQPENVAAEIASITNIDSIYAGDSVRLQLIINFPDFIVSATLSFGDDSTKIFIPSDFNKEGIAKVNHVYGTSRVHTLSAVVSLKNGTTKKSPDFAIEVKCKKPKLAIPDTVRTVTEGAELSLSLSGTGTQGATWLWKHNGDSISAKSVLAISNVKQSDSGRYTAIVRGCEGASDTSKSILVHVIPNTGSAPHITSDPQSVVASTGTRASFTVAANGNPTPAYQWKKNGITINGATSATFTIDSVKTSDTGTYSVDVMNTFDTVTSAGARLSIKPISPILPVILSQPQSASANKGGTVSLSVSANQTGLSYSWYKKGSSTVKSTLATITLVNVTYADSGYYFVIISNDNGSVSSDSTAKVSVIDNVKPTIALAGPTDTTIILGTTYTDPGVASAIDDRDGEVKASAVISSNTIKTSTPGRYTVTWQVSDLTGNKATASRSVRVVGWATVGADIPGSDFSIAAAANGDLFLAYVDDNQNVKAKVCSADSLIWRDLPGGTIATNSPMVKMDLDKTKTHPIVAFSDSYHDYEFQQYSVHSGSSWQVINTVPCGNRGVLSSFHINRYTGIPTFIGSNRYGSAATVGSLTDSTECFKAKYKDQDFPTLYPSMVLMASASQGQEFAALWSGSNVIINALNPVDSNWTDITGNLIAHDENSLYSLTLDKNDNPCLLFIDYVGNPTVSQSNGSWIWQNYGRIKTGAITAADLIWSSSGSSLFAAYIDGVTGKTDTSYLQIYKNEWVKFPPEVNGKLPVVNSSTTGGKLKIQISDKAYYATYLKNGNLICTLKYIVVP
jgi:hypothetical protein